MLCDLRPTQSSLWYIDLYIPDDTRLKECSLEKKRASTAQLFFQVWLFGGQNTSCFRSSFAVERSSSLLVLIAASPQWGWRLYLIQPLIRRPKLSLQHQHWSYVYFYKWDQIRWRESSQERVNLHSKPKFSQKVWIWSKLQQLLQLYSAASLWWSLGCTSFNGSHSTWAHTVEVQRCTFSVCVHLYSVIHHHSFYPPGPHPVCLFSHRSVFILRVRITSPGSKCQRSGINLASAPPRARSGEQMI